MLETVEDARRAMHLIFGAISPKSDQNSVVSRFIGVGKITWVGVQYSEGTTSFERRTIRLRRGRGVFGDRRCGWSAAPTDPLFKHLAPGVTTVNRHQAFLVADEDDQYLEQPHPEHPGEIIRRGAQGENVRMSGFGPHLTTRVKFGTILAFLSPEGEKSPLTVTVSGSRSNTLALMVTSSGDLGDEIGAGWFVAAFFDKI